MGFSLTLAPAAVRDLNKLEDEVARRILDALPLIVENPFPRGKLIKKIKGVSSPFYRLRIGTYRVFYCIERSEIIVLKVVLRKDAAKFIRTL